MGTNPPTEVVGAAEEVEVDDTVEITATHRCLKVLEAVAAVEETQWDN